MHLLLTINRFQTFLWYFNCWLLTSECQLIRCYKHVQELSCLTDVILHFPPALTHFRTIFPFYAPKSIRHFQGCLYFYGIYKGNICLKWFNQVKENHFHSYIPLLLLLVSLIYKHNQLLVQCFLTLTSCLDQSQIDPKSQITAQLAKDSTDNRASLF